MIVNPIQEGRSVLLTAGQTSAGPKNLNHIEVQRMHFLANVLTFTAFLRLVDWLGPARHRGFSSFYLPYAHIPL